MKVYFYCSYEHSVKGFFPLCVTEDGVTPCEGDVDKDVWDFFSYDRFKVLWREFPEKKGVKLFPEPEKSIFGIRGLNGNISGRSGVVNMAIAADQDELGSMEKIALSILDCYEEFTKMIFSFVSIGGEAGYDVDKERLFGYLKELKVSKETKSGKSKDKKAKLVRKLMDRQGIVTERDLLRFGVCTDLWKTISPHFGGKLLWGRCPWNVLDEVEFEELLKE